MGGESLSTVCATYPRLKDAWGDQLRHNMTLSCPEVARLVLFDRDSMLQHEEINLIASSAKSFTSSGQTLAQKDQLIHLFACYLINAESNDIEANLLALAQFILYLQRINFDVAGQLSEIEAFYESLVVALREGQLTMDNSGKRGASAEDTRHYGDFSGNIQGTVRNSALRDVGASILAIWVCLKMLKLSTLMRSSQALIINGGSFAPLHAGGAACASQLFTLPALYKLFSRQGYLSNNANLLPYRDGLLFPEAFIFDKIAATGDQTGRCDAADCGLSSIYQSHFAYEG